MNHNAPRARWPLSLRVVIGLVLGVIAGVLGGSEPYFLHYGNADLGYLGMLVIRLLKSLAVPLILFAILDAFISTPITARSGRRLVSICLFNVTVAFIIGLSLMNLFEPGVAWRGRIGELIAQIGDPGTLRAHSLDVTLDPLKNLGGFIPESLLDPLLHNNVISVVLMALLFGAALAQLKSELGERVVDTRPLERLITAMNALLFKVMGWVVELTPFAVFALVAHAVGKAGIGLFADLAGFLGIIVAGLSLHGLVYYPLAARWLGGIPRRTYLGTGADAILTGLSTNSSLATVPVTLRCLKKMGISETSSRLAACAGTNLNNDGVTLYEAMTALFLAQAVGFDLGITQQLVVLMAALMAGIGIAGIPEAGLIVLPLVLSAAGLPEALVAAAIPLIAPVDWIIARLRSAINVLSDMLVAILLDALERRNPQDHR